MFCSKILWHFLQTRAEKRRIVIKRPSDVLIGLQIIGNRRKGLKTGQELHQIIESIDNLWGKQFLLIQIFIRQEVYVSESFPGKIWPFAQKFAQLIQTVRQILQIIDFKSLKVLVVTDPSECVVNVFELLFR